MGMPSGAYSSQQAMPKEKRPHGYNKYAINNYDPLQQGLHEQNFAHVGPDSFTSRLASGDQSAFAEMESPAIQQFSGELGNIASRFSGQGSGGRKSSGFQNTTNQAAADFAMNLQSQRMGLRRQAIMDLMGMSDTILNRKTQEKGFAEKPHKESWADTALKWYTAYQGGENKGGGGGGSAFSGGGNSAGEDYITAFAGAG